MATIDSSIPLGIRPAQIEDPSNAMMRALQMRGFMDEREQKMQDRERTNRMHELLAGGADARRLREAGFLKESLDWEEKAAKTEHERAQVKKTDADTNTANQKLYRESVNVIVADPRQETAAALLDHLQRKTGDDLSVFRQAFASAGGDSEKIRQLALRIGVELDKQLPGFQTRNTGQTTDTLRTDPITGQVAVASSVQNTATPGDVLADQRGRAQIGETARHNKRMEGFRENEVGQANQAVTYQQDANGNYVALPTKVAPGSVVRGMPVAAPGAGMQPLAGKPSEGVQKELTSIRQQNAAIDGALSAVTQTPSAFSMPRGMATMAGAIPESLAGRMDNDAERQARSYVFNNVSKIINERAGAAQSAQELARLRSFLPAETDDAGQIESKLKAFKTYLGDMEAGTRGAKPSAPAPAAAASFPDPGKERRYQEWKARQAAQGAK